MAAPRLTPRLFCPSVVRCAVEADSPGVYILGHDDGGFVAGYVGRADSSLRSRLAGHELLGEFDYFMFRYARNAAEAFRLECELWHACRQSAADLGRSVHPAAPRGSGLECAYCYFAEHIQAILLVA